MAYRNLSKRERQIMDIIHRRSEASVSDVIKYLEDPSSYNSMRTLMNILEKKGHLSHRLEGNKYVYKATAQKESVKKTALDNLITTYFDRSALNVVSSLVSQQQLSEEELDRISKIIEDAKRKIE